MDEHEERGEGAGHEEAPEPEMCRRCRGTGDSWPLGAACGFCGGSGVERAADGDG